MTTIRPTERAIYWAATGERVVCGCTELGDLTGIAPAFQVTAAEEENEFVGQLDADAFPELPDEGRLEAGDIYQYEGEAVMVRRDHERTHYEPHETPNLFVTWREDADDELEWIENESVVVGTRRVYEDVVYECIQGHTTQSDWTPPASDALWAIVSDEVGDEWQVGVAYSVGDVVLYDGDEYECIQGHTSQSDWTPPATPTLWGPL